MFSFKYCPVAVLVLLLAACGAAPPRQAAGPREAPAQAPQPPRGGALYRIDPAQSELRLLVYRSGTMARLGHNHVIVNRSLDGWVAVAASIAASSFWLKIPAAAFAVDEAGARAEEGADFAAVVAEDAKSATLRNMLGAALLDADRFPDITVRSLELHESVDGSAAGTPVALLRIRVAGRDSTLSVPFCSNAPPDDCRRRGSRPAAERYRVEAVQRDARRDPGTGRVAIEIPHRGVPVPGRRQVFLRRKVARPPVTMP